MPEPTTITIAIIAVAAAATATVASVQQANAAERTAKFNKKVADNNATAQAQQAAYEARRLKDRQKRLFGVQRATAAKSGLTLDSFGDVFFDSAVQQELDRLTVLYKGGVAATMSKTQSQLFAAEAKNISSGKALGATATFLGGVAGSGTAGTVASDKKLFGP